MKIIFLDIDGVLNRHGDGKDFEPECVANLNRVLTATGAKLVISSTWRGLIENEHMDRWGFCVLLRSHGLKMAEVVGHTRPSEGGEKRVWQIRDWVFDHKHEFGTTRYCILDDDPNAFGSWPGVLVDGRVGLTAKDADAAIEILAD